MSDIYADEIQIRDFGNNKIPIFLITPNKESATDLADLIDSTNGNYKLKCFIKKDKSVVISLVLKLPDIEAELKIFTKKNLEKLPPS